MEKSAVPEVSKRVEEGLLTKQLVYAREQCKEPMERFVKCTNEVRREKLRERLCVCVFFF